MLQISYSQLQLLVIQYFLFDQQNMHQKGHQISLSAVLKLNFKKENEYLKIIQKNKKSLIKGSLGHNACFFIKPVIQGNFYIQVVGHLPKDIQRSYESQPCFRVGVAPTLYYFNYPLGQEFSVGYKMSGSVIQQGKHIIKLDSYNFQDVIGVGLHIQGPYKNRNKDRLSKQNYVQFFKNGKKIGKQLYLLSQDLYTFSASLFNQAQIQINFEPSTIKYLPEGYCAYSEHLKQRSGYRDHQLIEYENQAIQMISYQSWLTK